MNKRIHVSGNPFEVKVKEMWEKKGYDVLRLKRNQYADLICLKEGYPDVIIEAKSRAGKWKPDDREIRQFKKLVELEKRQAGKLIVYAIKNKLTNKMVMLSLNDVKDIYFKKNI